MYSRRAWLTRLAALSPTVSEVVRGAEFTDVDYCDPAGSRVNYVDAYNFCGDDSHNIALARCLDSLNARGACAAAINKYLTDLTGGRLTYGTLCELLVYDWLDQNGILFEAQVAFTGAEVLNPSGSHLDGKLTASSDVFFDVKGFGFQEMMIERLKNGSKLNFRTLGLRSKEAGTYPPRHCKRSLSRSNTISYALTSPPQP